MVVYLISSKEEKERQGHIQNLEKLFTGLNHIEAIYPSKIHIPFNNQIKEITKKRTGNVLSNGSLGCLLSHRKIWSKIANEKKNEFYLILESDSEIVSIDKINEFYDYVINNYDLFFWGAFDGRMKLFYSKKIKMNNYNIGEPFIKSLYCTYGYMINKKAAKVLLEQTKHFDYPVDYWKIRLNNTTIKVGGITPNLITTKVNFTSTISFVPKSFFHMVFNFIIDMKNIFITITQ